MPLNFGDLFSNALHDIKQRTGKKIAVLQDEIGYGFDPPIAGSTIEKWRYRPTRLTAVQLERLAELLVGYSHPEHDRAWLTEFLSCGGVSYPEPICDRLFPAEVPPVVKGAASPAAAPRLEPPDLIAYRPPAAPGFVGRTQELNHYLNTLKSDRLVVLAGMAGVGKTSLAVQLARASADHFMGVFWHTFHDPNVAIFIRRLSGFLAHFERPELWDLFEAARTAAVPPPPEATCFDLLTAALSDLPLLICLDDLHFVDDQPALTSFLRRFDGWGTRPTGPALLITARRFPPFLKAAAGRGELTGLSLPDSRLLLGERAPMLGDALGAELHRITAGNGAFLTMALMVLRDAPDPHRLIGRLAATPDIERFLLEEVDGRLTADEQAVMTATALLGGYPAQRDILQAMLDLEMGRVRRAIRRLLDQYLLLTHEGEGGRTYAQHHLLQAFYRAQPALAQRRTMHQRAAAYFKNETGELYQAVFNYIEAGAVQQAVEVAHNHFDPIINEGHAASLRTVLSSVESKGLTDELLLLLWLMLGRLDTLAGQYDRGRDYLERAARGLQSMPPSRKTDRLKGQVCLFMAELLERQSPPDGLRWAQRGLEVIGANHDEVKHALQIQAGTLMMHMGNFGGALEVMLDSLEVVPPTNQPLRLVVLKNLGAIYWHLDQLEPAQRYTGEALALSRRLRDHLQTARIAINLGPILYTQGDWSGAITALEEALSTAERLGSHGTILSLHVNLGRCYVEKGDESKARYHLEKGLHLADDGRAHQAIAARLNLARLHLFAGRVEEAQISLDQAEEGAQRMNDQLSLAAVHTLQADSFLKSGDLPAAGRLAQEAKYEARLVNDRSDEGICWRILGQIAAAAGDDEERERAFVHSLEILDPIDRYQAACTRLAWGEALLENGRLDAAAERLEEAYGVFSQLGAAREVARSKALLARTKTDD